MIKSAEIENFRCFEKARVPKCKQFNVVVGENASGKTSLLEALWIACGSSGELAVRVRNWRGFEREVTGSFEQVEDAIWSNLFYKFETDRTISVKLDGDRGFKRCVSIGFKKTETISEIRVTPDGNSPIEESAVEYSVQVGSSRPHTMRAIFRDGAFRFPHSSVERAHAVFFATAATFSNLEAVNRFSNLSAAKLEQPIVDAVTSEFHFIRNIEVLSHAGSSMLHADISGMPRKLPLSGVSSGVNKFMILLLAIAEQKDGVIFIDEIENGFHHSHYASIWKTLCKIAGQNRTQLFVSTHSAEFLEAIADETPPGEVSLIRPERINGAVEVEQFVGVGSPRLGEMR